MTSGRQPNSLIKSIDNPLLPAVLLGLAVAVLYWPAAGFDFFPLDDPGYVANNDMVRRGITAEGFLWSFSFGREGFWIPATWLSFMADVEIWGFGPGGFHRSNVILFSIGAALLFILLRRLTGSTGKSLVAAAIFAFHPMRVESVAWIAQRKDLLAVLFLILCLLAYERYARSGGWKAYAASLCFMLLSLLSKALGVTIPLLMLLIDFWPLGRFSRIKGESFATSPAWVLVREKIPFFLLAGLGALSALFTRGLYLYEASPLRKAAISAWAHAHYLAKTFLPVNLALSENAEQVTRISYGWALLFGAGLIAVSVAAFLVRRSYPYLAFGWFWFLVALLPVNGLVPTGNVLWSDKYMIIAQIGLAVAGVWLVDDLLRKRPGLRKAAVALAVCATVALAAMARSYLRNWKDGGTYFTYVNEVTGGSAYVMNRTGLDRIQEGRTDEAMHYFRQAISINPAYPNAYYNLALAFQSKNQIAEAVDYYRKALSLYPDDFMARYNLALVLIGLGELDEAEAHMRYFLKRHPDSPEGKKVLDRISSLRGNKG